MKEYRYKVKGVEYKVNIHSIEGNLANVEVNGVPFEVEMEGNVETAKPVAVSAPAPAPAPSASVAQATPKAAAPVSGKGKALKSPLPGVINDIKVAVGSQVKSGQVVLILEAMKMENEINAECDGTITSIAVNKGDSVMEGDVLLTIG